jgi:hypothetical protein
MHQQVKDFCKYVRRRHPGMFFNKRVLDVGSLDVNGTNKDLFWFCSYTGIDIIEGKNVHKVSTVIDFKSTPFDVVISTEMLEHDKDWQGSLQAMYKLTKKLLIITCATTGRPEHGTYRSEPESSPATNDYYRNLTADDIAGIIKPSMFREVFFRVVGTDLQFYGVK